MLESYREACEKTYFFLLHMSFCSMTRPFEKEGITVYLRMHRNVATQNQEHIGNQGKAAFLFFLVPEFAALAAFECKG